MFKHISSLAFGISLTACSPVNPEIVHYTASSVKVDDSFTKAKSYTSGILNITNHSDTEWCNAVVNLLPYNGKIEAQITTAKH